MKVDTNVEKVLKSFSTFQKYLFSLSQSNCNSGEKFVKPFKKWCPVFKFVVKNLPLKTKGKKSRQRFYKIKTLSFTLFFLSYLTFVSSADKQWDTSASPTNCQFVFKQYQYVSVRQISVDLCAINDIKLTVTEATSDEKRNMFQKIYFSRETQDKTAFIF